MNVFERDFFTDPEIIRDPVPYYAALRELGPVVREPHHGVGRDDPLGDQLISFDPPKRTRHRALLNKLLTPNRLEENEAFTWALADRLIDEFAGRG